MTPGSLRQHFFVWTVIAVVLAGGVFAADRPTHFGISLPVLKEVPSDGSLFKSRRPPVRIEEPVAFELDISDRGEVTKVTVTDERYAPVLRYYQRYLEAFTFIPGQRGGADTAFRLPVNLHVTPDSKIPAVLVPVDSTGVTDRNAYFEALETNGVMLPRVTEFPSYYHDLEWDDTLGVPPLLLAKVRLSEAGEVLESTADLNTAGVFGAQVETAIRYARFTPLKVDGVAAATDGFVLVTFYPGISYPTLIWTPEAVDTLSVQHRLRVRFLADTVGLMSPPVPRWDTRDGFAMYSGQVMYRDTVSVVLKVDSLGQASGGRRTVNSAPLASTVGQLVGQFGFYPALDYSGRAVRFSGLTHLMFEGSTNVRTAFFWLP